MRTKSSALRAKEEFLALYHDGKFEPGTRIPSESSMAEMLGVSRETWRKAQVGAPMPGMVSRVLVKEGDVVEQNQVLLIIEAMKMETSVVARMAGRVDKLLAAENTAVKAGELLAVIK